MARSTTSRYRACKWSRTGPAHSSYAKSSANRPTYCSDRRSASFAVDGFQALRSDGARPGSGYRRALGRAKGCQDHDASSRATDRRSRSARRLAEGSTPSGAGSWPLATDLGPARAHPTPGRASPTSAAAPGGGQAAPGPCVVSKCQASLCRRSGSRSAQGPRRRLSGHSARQSTPEIWVPVLSFQFPGEAAQGFDVGSLPDLLHQSSCSSLGRGVLVRQSASKRSKPSTGSRSCLRGQGRNSVGAQPRESTKQGLSVDREQGWVASVDAQDGSRNVRRAK